MVATRDRSQTASQFDFPSSISVLSLQNLKPCHRLTECHVLLRVRRCDEGENGKQANYLFALPSAACTQKRFPRLTFGTALRRHGPRAK